MDSKTCMKSNKASQQPQQAGRIVTHPRQHSLFCPRNNHTQKGVVLPVALILLVIISFAGILAVRNATVTEQMSNNLRTNVQAQQAAEAALRYCELVAISSKDSSAKQYAAKSKILATAVDDANSGSAAWRDIDNWKGSNVITPPDDYYTDTDAERDKIKDDNAPRCIIQPLVNTTHKLDGFLITARGFANNAKWDTSTAKLKSGSETWLQSVLTQ